MKKNGIPIVSDIKEAIVLAKDLPDYFIFGIAPSNGILTDLEKEIMLYAMSLHMSIVSGVHEFLSEDTKFITASKNYNVHVIDVRKPKDKKKSYNHLVVKFIMYFVHVLLLWERIAR